MNTDDARSRSTDETADGGTATQAAAPPPPPPPQAPRRLVRLPEASPGAGVAAGLGAYFGIDPVLVRLGFIALVFAGGLGILLYIACWIAMPKGSPADVAGAPATTPEQTTRWVAIGLAVLVGIFLLFQMPGFWGPGPGPWPVLWAIALIVLGVALFRWDADRRAGSEAARTSGAAPGAGATAQAASGTTRRTDVATGGDVRTGAAPTPPPPGAGAGGTARMGASPPAPPATAPPAYAPQPEPEQPTEPPSILGRLATGVGLLLLGLAALLDNAGVLALGAYHYVALALAITGVALLVGAWWGRARGFIAVGLLLIPLLVLTSVFGAGWPRGGEVGQRIYRPATVAEVADEYRLVAGELHVDLTDLDPEPGETVDIDAQIVFGGELVLVLPDDATVNARGRVSAGEVDLFGLTSGGLGINRTTTVDGGPDAPAFDVDARVGFGQVRVVHPEDLPRRSPFSHLSVSLERAAR